MIWSLDEEYIILLKNRYIPGSFFWVAEQMKMYNSQIQAIISVDSPSLLSTESAIAILETTTYDIIHTLDLF